jgi:hypothetical protein
MKDGIKLVNMPVVVVDQRPERGRTEVLELRVQVVELAGVQGSSAEQLGDGFVDLRPGGPTCPPAAVVGCQRGQRR